MINEKAKDITYGEFQHWMSGLIEGKRGQLPDLEDWKKIKSMMDRVKPDVETVTIPSYIPQTTPYIPPIDSTPWNQPQWNQSPSDIWGGSSIVDVPTSDRWVSSSDLEANMSSINKLKTME